MHAMVLKAPGAPLQSELRKEPVPGPGEDGIEFFKTAVLQP